MILTQSKLSNVFIRNPLKLAEKPKSRSQRKIQLEELSVSGRRYIIGAAYEMKSEEAYAMKQITYKACSRNFRKYVTEHSTMYLKTSASSKCSRGPAQCFYLYKEQREYEDKGLQPKDSSQFAQASSEAAEGWRGVYSN